MKRITVSGPVTLRLNDERHTFAVGNTYEVEDEVAAHPYLKQYILREEAVAEPETVTEPAKPKKTGKKQAAKQEVDHDQPADAAPAAQ